MRTERNEDGSGPGSNIATFVVFSEAATPLLGKVVVLMSPVRNLGTHLGKTVYYLCFEIGFIKLFLILLHIPESFTAILITRLGLAV